MADSPHIAIIARAVCMYAEHVLVCQHVPQGGYFVLPGGHVEFGEPACVAVRREFVEEVGFEPAVGSCVAGFEQIFEHPKGLRHELTLVFHVEHPPHWKRRWPGGPPPLVSPEEPKVRLVWIPMAEIETVDLRPARMRTWLARRVTGSGGGDPARIDWLT